MTPRPARSRAAVLALAGAGALFAGGVAASAPEEARARAVSTSASTASDEASHVPEKARALHRRALVVDGHVDTTQRLLDAVFDFGARHADGHVDIPRLREGGLDAAFFSIWTPGTTRRKDAVRRALAQIDAVHRTVAAHPDDLVMATTAREIRRAHDTGRIAVLMGLEGGHMIADDLGRLREYAGRGVRYLTLTHSVNTGWADSSGGKPRHDGLTPFGREVVRELNRLGVMVDISHVADATFADVLEVTRAPVIASHSSCRALCDHPRNLTDDMLRALGKNGGVVMINYATLFLDQRLRNAERHPPRQVVRARKEATRDCVDEACRILGEFEADAALTVAGVLPVIAWEKIVDHIDHAVKVAGVDHVGLGSDFDGATMPRGMDDASMLPRITAALLERGYAEADVEKILGGNVLRVMEEVEIASRRRTMEPLRP